MAESFFTLGDLRSSPESVFKLAETVFNGDESKLQVLSNRFFDLARIHPGHDTRPAMILNVPGRIEVLGKHTDYAGGVSLTCASSLSMASIVLRHPARSLIVIDAVRGVQVEIPYDFSNMEGAPSWVNYVGTVLARMIRHFGDPGSGVSLFLGSDVPSASGMSSSSGLIVSTALALFGMGNFSKQPLPDFSRERFSGFAGALESGADFESWKGDEGVGTKGGSQDHTAILCSTAGSLGLFSYFPVHRQDTVPFPEDVTFVIGTSGVKARKTGEAQKAYNLASQRASEVVSTWNTAENASVKTMGEMVLHPAFNREALRDSLKQTAGLDSLWNRFLQFDRECSVIIPGAILALRSKNWEAFGRFTDESQRMADTLLGNQVPETNDLARIARDLGARGANAFGAGFGGAVWAVVEKQDSQRFLKDWSSAYASRHPSRMVGARFFADSPSSGVSMLGAPSFRF